MTRSWYVRLLILSTLADGCRDGSGIIAGVGDLSTGSVRLCAGSLFAALYRLRLERLIAIDREEIVAKRLRRYYRLTPAGREHLDRAAHGSAPALFHNNNQR
jgi:DNA-binding PadR family transcriptional regulator